MRIDNSAAVNRVSSIRPKGVLPVDGPADPGSVIKRERIGIRMERIGVKVVRKSLRVASIDRELAGVGRKGVGAPNIEVPFVSAIKIAHRRCRLHHFFFFAGIFLRAIGVKSRRYSE